MSGLPQPPPGEAPPPPLNNAKQAGAAPAAPSGLPAPPQGKAPPPPLNNAKQAGAAPAAPSGLPAPPQGKAPPPPLNNAKQAGAAPAAPSGLPAPPQGKAPPPPLNNAKQAGAAPSDILAEESHVNVAVVEIPVEQRRMSVEDELKQDTLVLKAGRAKDAMAGASQKLELDEPSVAENAPSVEPSTLREDASPHSPPSARTGTRPPTPVVHVPTTNREEPQELPAAKRSVHCIVLGDPCTNVTSLFARYQTAVPQPLSKIRAEMEGRSSSATSSSDDEPLLSLSVIDTLSPRLLTGVDIGVLVCSPAYPYSFERLESWKESLSHIVGVQWVLVASRVEMLALPTVQEMLQHKRIAPPTPSDVLDFFNKHLDSKCQVAASLAEASPTVRHPSVFAVSRRVNRDQCLHKVMDHLLGLAETIVASGLSPGGSGGGMHDVQLLSLQSNDMSVDSQPSLQMIDSVAVGGWDLVEDESSHIDNNPLKQQSSHSEQLADDTIFLGEGAQQFSMEWSLITAQQSEKVAPDTEWLTVRDGESRLHYSRASGAVTRTMPAGVVENRLCNKDDASPTAVMTSSPTVFANKRASAFDDLQATAEVTMPVFKQRKAMSLAEQQRHKDKQDELDDMKKTAADATQQLMSEIKVLTAQRDAMKVKLSGLKRDRQQVEETLAVQRMVAADEVEKAQYEEKMRELLTSEQELLAGIAESKSIQVQVDSQLPKQLETLTSEYVAAWNANKITRKRSHIIREEVEKVQEQVAKEKKQHITDVLEPRLKALTTQIHWHIEEFDKANDAAMELRSQLWAPKKTHSSFADGNNSGTAAVSKPRLVYNKVVSASVTKVKNALAQLGTVSLEMFDIIAALSEEDIKIHAAAVAQGHAEGHADGMTNSPQHALAAWQLAGAWRNALQEEQFRRYSIELQWDQELLAQLMVWKQRDILQQGYGALRAYQWKLDAL